MAPTFSGSSQTRVYSGGGQVGVEVYHPKDLDMLHAVFAAPCLSTFCRLDELIQWVKALKADGTKEPWTTELEQIAKEYGFATCPSGQAVARTR